MSHKRLDDILAVELTCGATDTVGDVVEITGDLTVAKITGAGSIKIVGTIAKRILDGYGFSPTGKDTKAVIETKFREMRDDRLAGGVVPVGPFVWGATGKAIAYSSASHDPAAIAGLCISAGGKDTDPIVTLEY